MSLSDGRVSPNRYRCGTAPTLHSFAWFPPLLLRTRHLILSMKSRFAIVYKRLRLYFGEGHCSCPLSSLYVLHDDLVKKTGLDRYLVGVWDVAGHPDALPTRSDWGPCTFYCRGVRQHHGLLQFRRIQHKRRLICGLCCDHCHWWNTIWSENSLRRKILLHKKFNSLRL